MSKNLPNTVTVWMPKRDPAKHHFRGRYRTSYQGRMYEFLAEKRYIVPRAFAEGVLSKVRQSNVAGDDPDDEHFYRPAFIVRENGNAMDEAVAAKEKKIAGTPDNPIDLTPPAPPPKPAKDEAPAGSDQSEGEPAPALPVAASPSAPTGPNAPKQKGFHRRNR